ncbi:phosphoadenosine phosphosulfate reductase domain-containing protein [Nonomuraea sp. 10N515B]|uniref:phosphoadenosine phosphosulfate reductase domain-containing protein n=1 Tax=Nonomuraea sp. 10N515B TaxID=3457422 RepID=UPI003FCE08A2
MAEKLWNDVLNEVQHVCDRYQLIPLRGPVAVAFSGGKDSLLLSLALRELRVPIVCIAVDMGYEPDWGRRITALAERTHLPVEVVDVRRETVAKSQEDRRRIGRNLRALNVIQPNATPCTHCYNVKVVALENAVRDHGASTIAFGHHRTDALASLIKEALMYIDRWDRGHPVFVRDNFAELVEQLKGEAEAPPDVDHALSLRIAELVHADIIDTDEPARQPLNRDNPGVNVIRPLFLVDERTIIEIMATRLIDVEGSGCGHGLSANYLTPREMVHYGVLRATYHPWFDEHMQRLLMYGIDAQGGARLEARRRRVALLGDQYKPSINKF